MEVFNHFLEKWEPLWLFLILYFEGIVCVLTYHFVRKEWESSQSLDKKFDKVISKYITRLESTHYKLLKKVLPKQRRRRK